MSQNQTASMPQTQLEEQSQEVNTANEAESIYAEENTIENLPVAKAEADKVQTETPEEAPEDASVEIKDTSEKNLENNEEGNNSPELKGFHNRAIIFVMSGLHKGAGCAIDKETTIGSNFDNDLIITDEHIAAKHLVLRPIEKGLDFAVEVICKGENIIINGEAIIETEQSVIMQDTFILTLGTISINVTLHKAAKTSVVYKKYMVPNIRKLEVLGNSTKTFLSPQTILSDVRNIILFIVAIIIMISIGTYYFTLPVEKEKLQSSNADYRHIKALPFKEKMTIVQLSKQAKSDLIEVLKRYDLFSRLTVSSENAVIFVKGRLNQYELKNWRKVLNWFDTIYGTRLNIVKLIEVNNGLRRTISFKAVVADGEVPYVVSWTGDRFKPGATLPGGWIILKIGHKGVTVKDARDNRIFLVKHIRSQHGMKLPRF